MKESLSYIEVTALVRELEKLKGAKINKIYQPKKQEIIIVLHHPELRKLALKIHLPRYITISGYKQEFPTKPSHFAMFLRKYLTNARLVSITQPPFERIVEFHFQKEDRFILLVELFSKGNVIICDRNYHIMIPLSSQSWKDRTIRPKEKYVFPQKRMDFEDLEIENFKSALVSSEKEQIVKALAIVMGLGGTYAEELCLNSGIDKKKGPTELKDEEYRILFKEFITLLEKSKEGEINPHIIFEEGEAVDIQPFRLNLYANNEIKEFSSYTEALDEYFMQHFKDKKIEAKETEIDKEIIKQEAKLKQHENYLEELKEKSEKFKKYGDIIYQHLGEIQDIVQNINNARDKDIEWSEILNRIEKGRSQGNKEAMLIKEVIPDRRILILNLDEGIELDFKVPVTDSANHLYTQSKKLESKISGVENAIIDAKQKIEELKERRGEVEESIESEAPEKIEKAQTEWYERYHWFFTSEGKLAIGGRDATQNEVIIKKHLEPDDIVFHTEAPGSPFLILKNGRESSDAEKKEAAIFVLCHSKAWQEKRITDVYAVKPEQLSKKAPAGEYIARGGFMVYGKKEYIKDIELRHAVGVQIGPFKVISGPVDNVRLKARYYAILVPGEQSKDEIAKSIKDYWLNMSRTSDSPIIESIPLETIKRHALQDSDIFGLIK